jgi:GR25 family glycosyltransferase involved in LPS biosynthesis
MLTESVSIYVISLPSAHDRREYISRNLGALNVSFSFVDGTTPPELPPNKQNSAIAIWDSHVKVMKMFLNTQAQFACIFEDDIDLAEYKHAKQNFFQNIYQLAKSIPHGYSILQLGTMRFKSRSLLFVALRELYFLRHGHYRFDALPLSNLVSRLGEESYLILSRKIAELTQFKSKPVEGFCTGAQAYVLDRSAAEYLVQNYSEKLDWDLSSRYSMDTFLESESRSSKTPSEIRTIRLSKQLFAQRRIPSMNNYFPSR